MTAVSEPFDHAVVVCGDLDAAAANWRALGFTLTPRGYHTLGSQNHCIMLARDYLELLHVTAPSPSRQYYWDAQQRGDGCAAMSCKSRDAFATAARLRAAGYKTSDPIEFSRPVRLDDGSEHPATFRVTALDDAPGARYFVCEHRTPELLWRPEWLAHANGATAIEAAYLVVEAGQVGAAAAAYVEITAGKLIAADDRVARIAVDGAELVISTADALAEVTGTLQITAESTGYAAIRLRTSDLAKARTYWGTQSIATVDLGPQATLIPAASANGVALIFAQA
ncbi:MULTISPECIES: VOC family protein [unclassified Cupriavidus]|uniref:VOC family protein n=1 Tax=unclassified Cupriavidus TaxID=2640874 RepID=UPI003F92BC12